MLLLREPKNADFLFLRILMNQQLQQRPDESERCGYGTGAQWQRRECSARPYDVG